jgi:DNA-binding protein HU-beta
MTPPVFLPTNRDIAAHKLESPGKTGAFLLNNRSKWLFSAKKPLAFRVNSTEFRATALTGIVGTLPFLRKVSAMNKNDLIAAVAEKTGLTKAQAGEAVDATFEAVTSTLKSGDEVRIIGFGNFTVSERAATEGRNPRTGETIQIPASKTPKFKAGKGLKDAVNA